MIQSFATISRQTGASVRIYNRPGVTRIRIVARNFSTTSNEYRSHVYKLKLNKFPPVPRNTKYLVLKYSWFFILSTSVSMRVLSFVQVSRALKKKKKRKIAINFRRNGGNLQVSLRIEARPRMFKSVFSPVLLFVQKDYYLFPSRFFNFFPLPCLIKLIRDDN